MRKLVTATALFLALGSCAAIAQDDAILETKPMPEVVLPFDNPIEHLTDQHRQLALSTAQEISPQLSSRIADIYELHIRGMRAQINNDLVEAEEYIIKALEELQAMMEDAPEVQSHRKFTELYRTVMAGYQEFYGVDEPLNQSYGDIFAVRQEMFMQDDEWFDGDYFTLPEDIQYESTEVPLIRNQQVNNHIAYLTIRRPEVMQAWLERSQRYFPMMREIFEEEGVPQELIHLAMVESGLRPTARSHARAVGMWQFIYATGSTYGLERDWWIDERRDPVKSTRAAARHLRDLYDYWDDWHLAMANYNVSTRRMRWAVRQAGGSEDYWDIFPYLPRETRGYVPGFIAATMIATNPEEFGFEIETVVDPYEYEVAEVDGSIDLSTLAEAAGITTQKLREYNPELLRWATPPGSNPYPLKLPMGTKETFVENYEQIPDEERQGDMVVHTVSSGESLGSIANRYGTSVRNIHQVNDNLSNTIHPGQRIAIPVRESSASAIRSDEPSAARTAQSRSSSQQTRQTSSRGSQPANTTAVRYTVKQGDTVGHIAEWFDTQAWRIRSWNNIGNMIRPGQTLTLYVPEGQANHYRRIDDLSFAEKQELDSSGGTQSVAMEDSGEYGTYTVRTNDNLSIIANRFNTSVQQLMNINDLSSSRIYVGQTLRVPN